MSIWSNAKQFVICFGIGLLALILGYATDINFLQQRLNFVKKQKIKISLLLQNKTQVTQEAKIENQRTAKLKQWDYEFNIINILDNLEQAAIYSQVELQVLEPQAIRDDEFFIAYPIKLEINGQYKNLLKFINNMFKQPYFILFEELVMQKKFSDELNAQVLIVAYKNKVKLIQTKYSVYNLLPYADNIVVDEFQRDLFAKATGSSANLFLWSTKELIFLGMIKQDRNTYGFVSDPVGVVHRVTIGDKVGLKQKKITAINEHGIIIEK